MACFGRRMTSATQHRGSAMTGESTDNRATRAEGDSRSDSKTAHNKQGGPAVESQPTAEGPTLTGGSET